MSKHNGTGPDVLVPSNSDCIQLAEAVNDRVQDLMRTHRVMQGMDLHAPVEMKSDFVRWQAMLKRHRSGDMRHRKSELMATRAVAQWSVNVQRALRNQPPELVEWRE